MESVCEGLNAISVQIHRDDSDEEDEGIRAEEKERQIEVCRLFNVFVFRS